METLDVYGKVIQRRWKIIALVTGIFIVLGFLASQKIPETYQSESRVQVRPLTVQGDNPELDFNRQVNMETEISLAKSKETNLRAAEISGIDIDILEESLTVQVIRNSAVISFTGEAAKPEKAQAMAQAAAEAYVESRQGQAQVALDEVKSRLEDREAELYDELEQLSNDIADAKASAEAQALIEAEERAELLGVELSEVEIGEGDQRNVQALQYQDIAKREELAAIGSRLGSLSTIEVDGGSIIDPAELPKAQAGIPSLAVLTGFTLIGLLIGYALGALRERSNKTIVDITGIPSSLELVDSISKKDRKYEMTKTAAILRSRFGNLEDKKPTVLLTSIGKGTNTAIDLATCFAGHGRKVVIVDIDYKGANKPGVAEFVFYEETGQEPAGEPVISITESILYISPGNMEKLPVGFASKAYVRFVKQVEELADIVIVNTGPADKDSAVYETSQFFDMGVVELDSSSSRKETESFVNAMQKIQKDMMAVFVEDK